MDEEKSIQGDFTKKERVVNSFLLPEDLSISEISDVADCSYEYARQIVRDIQSGEIDPNKLADADLQSQLTAKIKSPPPNTSIEDFGVVVTNDSPSEEESSVEESEGNEERASISEVPENTSYGSDQQPSEQDEEIPISSLGPCLDSMEELKTEAQFYIEEGDDGALEQYYVAQRAIQLVRGLIEDSSDETVSRAKVEELRRIFVEFYHEADFQAEHDHAGAARKKYTAYRAVAMLESVLNDASN